MTQIAQQDGYIVDGDGIRRQVVAGSPIPGWQAAQLDTPQETVPTRDLAAVVVDEDASKSQAQRAAEGAAVGVPTGQEEAGKEAAKTAKAARGKASGGGSD